VVDSILQIPDKAMFGWMLGHVVTSYTPFLRQSPIEPLLCIGWCCALRCPGLARLVVDFNVLSWWRGVGHAGPLRSLGVSNDGGGGEFQSLIILVADAIVLPLS